MSTLRPELLDESPSGYEKPEDHRGEEGLFRQLKQTLPVAVVATAATGIRARRF